MTKQTKKPLIKSLEPSPDVKDVKLQVNSISKNPRPKLTIKLVLAVIFGLLAGGLVFLLIFLTTSFNKIFISNQNQPENSTSVEQTEQIEEKSPVTTIALLGYGGGTHAGGNLTDTIIVARLNEETKTITLISIPRDLWVNMQLADNEQLSGKINLAYQVGRDDKSYPNKSARFAGEAGGGQLAKETITTVIGWPVDYYAAVSFQGFTRAIDILGGVDVNVTNAFIDDWYPLEGEEDNPCDKTDEEIASLTATMSGFLLEQQFPCRYESLHFNQVKTHMDGITALKYVRSRHSNQSGNDFARSDRQKSLIIAVKNKILSISFLPRLIPFIENIANEVKTDIPWDLLLETAKKPEELSDYSITSLSINDQNALKEARINGQFALIVDEAKILENNSTLQTLSDSATSTSSGNAIDSASVTSNWTILHNWLQQQISEIEAATAAANLE